MSRMSFIVPLILVAGVSSGTLAQADELAPQQVVVVATRSPENIDRIGNSVTVLDQQAIVASQATVVTDLLATTPGITFNRNGGPGSATSLNIRGAASDQTVVLIDGVALNDPSSPSGAANLSNLLVGDIARIEVLRGSQSTLYGSQAMGGVINIITAEPGAGLDGSIQGEYGSLRTGLAQAAVGDRIGKLSFRLGAGYYGTDSVSALDRKFGGMETDPFHNSNVSGRINYDITPDVQLDLRTYYTDGLANYDGFPPPAYVFADEGDSSTTRQLVNYSGLNFNMFGGQLKNRVAYQYTTVDRVSYLNAGGANDKTGGYSGVNGRFEYQGTLAIAPGYQAVFGAQQENSHASNWSTYTPVERDETGVNSIYAQLQGEVIKGLTLTGGERRDHDYSFGVRYTGQVAAAYALPSNTVLRASWGQGFKAPSLYQLYSPYGNPSLNPERSTSWDAGMEQHVLNGRVLLSVTYFSTRFNSLIEYESCPGNPACLLPGNGGGYYVNLNRAKSDGVELQAAINVSKALRLTANYTHTRSLDETPGSATYGMQGVHIPKDAANAQLGYTWPTRLNTTIAARFAGASRDVDYNTYPNTPVKLGGYTLVDFRASWPISSHLEIYGRIDNVFNKYYETVYQFGTWGRTGFVGLRATL